MGQEFQVPAVFANKQMSPAFQAALAGQRDSLADGIGQSYAVIGYKGKVWSLRSRGQRYNILRPDDGTPSSYLDVIILNKAAMKSKSYYPKYEPGSSDGERPICASLNGLTPDPDVTQKQSDSCALCPRNVFKTDPQTGRKSRECTDYMRLAVLILPTQTKPILGEPLLEPVFLRVPPASLNSLAIMGDTMDKQGYHYASYVTRITFDPNKSWPEMVFRPLQQLTDGEAPVILQLRQDPLAQRIVGGDFGGTDAPPPMTLPPAGAATGIASLAGPSGQTASPTMIGSLHGTAAAPPATPSIAAAVTTSPGATGLLQPPPPSDTPPSQAVAATGIGAGGEIGGAPPASTLVGSTTPASLSDAGEAEESDAELDARIAAMIGGKAA